MSNYMISNESEEALSRLMAGEEMGELSVADLEDLTAFGFIEKRDGQCHITPLGRSFLRQARANRSEARITKGEQSANHFVSLYISISALLIALFEPFFDTEGVGSAGGFSIDVVLALVAILLACCCVRMVDLLLLSYVDGLLLRHFNDVCSQIIRMALALVLVACISLLLLFVMGWL